MNILLTHTAGPSAMGLTFMVAAIRAVHRDCNLTILVPTMTRGHLCGAGSNGEDLSEDLAPPLADGIHRYNGTVVDCIDLAFLRQELFLTRPTPWDKVIIGVEQGLATGAPDLLKNGAAAAALYASSAYGAAAHAVLQSPSDEPWANTPKWTTHSIRAIQPGAGECWITNIPAGPVLGEDIVPLAHYSGIRTPPTAVVPRARNEHSAPISLAKSFVVHSRAVLRLNVELRY